MEKNTEKSDGEAWETKFRMEELGLRESLYKETAASWAERLKLN